MIDVASLAPKTPKPPGLLVQALLIVLAGFLGVFTLIMSGYSTGEAFLAGAGWMFVVIAVGLTLNGTFAGKK